MIWVAVACTAPANSRSAIQDPYFISTAELDEMREARVRDLYDVVYRLRPRWLQPRSERSLRLETIILVYHDQAPLGGPEALVGYPLRTVISLRYLNASEAGLLPGAGSAHLEGAIVIRTSTEPRDTTAVH